jgi:hypothetical protein
VDRADSDAEQRCAGAHRVPVRAERVPVRAERQLEDRPAFEAVGWTVLTHPVDASELVALLRERGA